MNNTLFLSILFCGIAIGCVGTHIARTSTAVAQPGQFQECVRYNLDYYDGDLEDLPTTAKPIMGWTPVGGWQAGVVLCR